MRAAQYWLAAHPDFAGHSISFDVPEYLPIIEWQDDSRDTIAWRFPDQDKAIKAIARAIRRSPGGLVRPGPSEGPAGGSPAAGEVRLWPEGGTAVSQTGTVTPRGDDADQVRSTTIATPWPPPTAIAASP